MNCTRKTYSLTRLNDVLRKTLLQEAKQNRLGLTNFFSAKTAPNSKRVRCAVYKRLRENGASWAKQLNDSTSGSFGEGGGGEGVRRRIVFVFENDCW